MKVTATLGKTRFDLEDDTPGILKITRHNEKVTEFFVPRTLIIEYEIQVVKDAVPRVLQEFIR